MLPRYTVFVMAILGGGSLSGACSNTTSVAPGPGPVDAGQAPQPDAQVAAPQLPTTDIDPCRGQALPDATHYVPPGMCARFIGKVPGARQLTFAPNGDLFATSGTAIFRLRDADGDGFFKNAEITEWAKTTGTNDGLSNNVHIDVASGFLYVGSLNGVRRFRYSPDALAGEGGEDVVLNLPKGGHQRRTVRVYDGFLYAYSGSSSNVSHEGADKSIYDTKRSLIKRFELSKFVPGTPFDWNAGEVFTVGLRNANGFTRNEATGKIYAVVNGLDNQAYKGKDVHTDNPGEQIVEIAKGKQYGYPFCFTAQRVFDNGDTGNLIAPGTQLINVAAPGGHDDAWCAANSSKPATFVQAHSAPLDLAFFATEPRGALPERWRGGAFVAFHGSWNRESAQTGRKVVWQPFNADGTAPMPSSDPTTTTFPYETVFGGGNSSAPEDGVWKWATEDSSEGDTPRPAGVAVSPIDGALYIASDVPGMLYRVGLKK